MRGLSSAKSGQGWRRRNDENQSCQGFRGDDWLGGGGWSLVAFGFLAAIVLVGYWTDSEGHVVKVCEEVGAMVLLFHVILLVTTDRKK
jgi:hypothetical protein